MDRADVATMTNTMCEASPPSLRTVEMPTTPELIQEEKEEGRPKPPSCTSYASRLVLAGLRGALLVGGLERLAATAG